MKRNFFMLWMGIGALIITSQYAAATPAQNCGDHAVIMERLADRYGERRQGMGLSGDTAVLEIFASDETGTWSITITTAGGPTCLVAAGQAFQLTNDPLPNTDQGA